MSGSCYPLRRDKKNLVKKLEMENRIKNSADQSNQIDKCENENEERKKIRTATKSNEIITNTIGIPTNQNRPVTQRKPNDEQNKKNRTKPKAIGLSSISALYYNISGSKSKIHKLNDLLTTTAYDIVAITETWWTDSESPDIAVAGTDFEVNYRNRVTNPHGGVAIFTKKALRAKVISTWDQLVTVEAISIEIEFSNRKTLISLLYWPPGQMNLDVTDMQTIIQWNEQQPLEDKIILGDFNLSGLSWEESEHQQGIMIPNISNARPFERDVAAQMDDSGFAQMNDSPNSFGHVLDLIFCSKPESCRLKSIFEAHSIIYITREHLPIVLELNYDTCDAPETNYIEKRHVNHQILSQKLAAIVPCLGNSIEQIRLSLDEIMQAIHDSTKIRKIRIPSWAVRHPWLLDSVGYKKIRAKLQKAKRIPGNATEIRRIHISLRETYDRLKTNYFRKVMNSLSGDKKELYDILRFKKKKTLSIPEEMVFNGQTLIGSARYDAIASHLNEAFAEADQELYEGDIENNMHELWRANFAAGPSWVEFESISEEEIIGRIAKLDTKKDSGPMKIAASTVKQHANAIAKLLSPIFTYCSKEAWIPDEWKEAYMTPIPKKGDVKDVKNYRGICMSSTIPKLFDAIVTAKIEQSVDETLSTAQHGFRKNRGTNTSLLEATQYIESNMSSKSRVDAIFIDFEKAFDKVSHATIVKKLAQKGAPMQVLRTIMQLVIGRKYTLKIRGLETDLTIQPMSSVPQGSHIGPVLFIIVVDDLESSIPSHTRMIQYADDVLLLQTITVGSDKELMQESINRTLAWADVNKLKINTGKTKAVMFTKGALDWGFQYKLGEQQIETVDNQVYLGVNFDRKLNFNQHVQELGAKSIRMANVAARLSKYIGHRALNITLFKIYNDPTVNYAAHVWNRERVVTVRTLEAGHRRSTRNALGTPFRPHIPGYIDYHQRCARLGIPTLQQRRCQQAAVMGMKMLRNETKTLLSQELQDSIYVPRMTERGTPPLFDLRRASMGKLPLGRIAVAVDKLKDRISLEHDSLYTIKKKVKENLRVLL